MDVLLSGLVRLSRLGVLLVGRATSDRREGVSGADGGAGAGDERPLPEFRQRRTISLSLQGAVFPLSAFIGHLPSPRSESKKEKFLASSSSSSETLLGTVGIFCMAFVRSGTCLAQTSSSLPLWQRSCASSSRSRHTRVLFAPEASSLAKAILWLTPSPRESGGRESVVDLPSLAEL